MTICNPRGCAFKRASASENQIVSFSISDFKNVVCITKRKEPGSQSAPESSCYGSLRTPPPPNTTEMERPYAPRARGVRTVLRRSISEQKIGRLVH
jgi:hypothetical protein